MALTVRAASAKVARRAGARTMDSPAPKTVILIIDSELQMRRLLRACLERSNYEVAEAATGDEGLSASVQFQPGIIILDLVLPDMDGMAVLHRLREWTNAPIVILSAKNTDNDKVLALDDGANDYLTKPFSTNELLARLRVLLRYPQRSAPAALFISGRLQVDLVSRTVKVGGAPIKLPPTEYALLRYFVQYAGKVLTHGQLLREVWNLSDAEKTGRLRVYVTHLREKIETHPAKPELIITVPGVGYRLEVREPVSTAARS